MSRPIAARYASLVQQAPSQLRHVVAIERQIVEQRLMAHPDDQSSLAEVGRRFQISRERARQLEVRAIRKLKVALTHSAMAAEWIARLAA
jgi:DNA-directed RNA polymerase sigma subunit (sigma70/sigma32)